MQFSWLKIRTISVGILVPALAVLMALAVGGILIVARGVNPLLAYCALLSGAFGSARNFSETMVKATPLLLVGLGVAMAFRCSVWNIGSEGQLQMGAVAATVMGLTLTGMPAVVLIPLIVVAGFLAGAFWGAIPGALKAKWEVNEVITTIMMNYVATFFVSYLLSGPMKDPTAGGVPLTPAIAAAARLPSLMPPTRLHGGIVIALLCAVLVYVLLWKTVLGYQIRAVGGNPRAASYAGISVTRNVVLVMILSGGLAGLAGMGEVVGLHYRLIEGFSPGYGFTGVVVALLGKLHPVGIVLASVLFGALMVGADAMARATGVPIALVSVIEGLVILFVLGSEILTRRGGKQS